MIESTLDMRRASALADRRAKIDALTRGIDKAMAELRTTTDAFRLSHCNSCRLEDAEAPVPVVVMSPKPSSSPSRLVASRNSPSAASPLGKRWEGRLPFPAFDFGFSVFNKYRERFRVSDEMKEEMATGTEYSTSLLLADEPQDTEVDD